MLHLNRPRVRASASIVLSAAFAGLAVAGDAPSWTLTVDPAVSQTDGSSTVASDLAGFLIGDFDPETNPDGTSTLPGIFGGSGNQPVDLTLDLAIGGPFAGGVSGGLQALGDPASGELTLSGLSLDLLSGSAPPLPLTVTVLFETFRTFNPDSLFPGGIPLEVPLGEATVSSLEALQIGAALVTATPAGKNSYTLAGEVSLLLFAEVSALGDVLLLPPVAVTVPLEASGITIDGKGVATLSLGFAFAVSEEDTGPFEEPVLDGVPFDLPTVFPPGDIAGVEFTATPESVSTSISLTIGLVASGPQDVPATPGDANGDGVVDFADILVVLATFGSCGAGLPCPGDLNDDQAVDFTDILIVLSNWTA